MFNIDWTNVAKQLAEKIQESSVKNAILKMKADIFIMHTAQGASFDEAWKKASEASKFFEEKIK